MTDSANLREHVAKLLSWEEAHASFDAAVANLSAEKRGTAPAGLPYSPWQLVEHLRITQHDILDFCRNPGYEEMSWPKDYWPASAAPPSAEAWSQSIEQFHRDRSALEALARDESIDLGARIPHGSGQTYLRELLLAADHAAYHVGELIVVRRLLGAWKTAA
jgi:DinB superfamily